MTERRGNSHILSLVKNSERSVVMMRLLYGVETCSLRLPITDQPRKLNNKNTYHIMFQSITQRLFTLLKPTPEQKRIGPLYERADPQKRIYVVTGEQYADCDQLDYSTDPADYGFKLPAIKPKKKTPNETQTKIPNQDRAFDKIPQPLPVVTKVFQIPDDAIAFAYDCHLNSVALSAFDHINNQWSYSQDQSILQNIDW